MPAPLLRNVLLVAFSATALVAGGMALGCGSSVEQTPGAEPENGDPADTTGGDPPAEDPPPFEATFEDGGAPTDDGGTGGVNPGGTLCADPNDAPSGLGRALPDTDDCNQSLLSITGIAATSVDEDVYTLSAADKLGCNLDTTFNLETAKMEMCVFVQCKVATPDAVSGCEEGTLTTDTQTSLKGCCRTNPGAVVPTFDCNTTDDSANFTMRLKPNPGAPMCQAYSVRYRY